MIRKNMRVFIGVLIGILISGISVYGAGRLYANSIDIEKDENTLTNVTGNKVQDALDYLYESASHIGECPNGLECNLITNPGYLPTSDSTTYTQSTFVQNLKVGDLIKMTPSTSSVRLDGTKSGYRTYITTPTYLNPSELQYWRVIRKNTNGTVDVVSEYLSSINVYFNGISGYANYIGYLNELASYYENPTYTIGSRYMGYNGQTQYIIDISKFNSSIMSAPWSSSTSSSTTSADEALGAGDMGYTTDYNLVQTAYAGTIYDTDSSITTDQAKAYKVGTTTATTYWLASRYYYFSSSSYFTFYGRKVNTTGGFDTNNLAMRHYGGGWMDYSYNYALRPILTLKSTITSSGTEAETGAYILG